MTETFLTILMFIPLTDYTKSSDASRAAAEAAYKQLGLETKVNEFFHGQVEKLPAEYKEIGNKVLPAANLIINRRIELRYEF